MAIDTYSPTAEAGQLSPDVSLPQVSASAEDPTIPTRRAQELTPSIERITPQTPRQLQTFLYLLADHTQAGIFSTTDKLGNLPDSINDALGLSPGRIANKAEAVRLMRSYAADPVSFAAQTDKVKILGTMSELPDALREILINLVMKEGDRNATEAFTIAASRIEIEVGEDLSQDEQKQRMQQILREVKKHADGEEFRQENQRRWDIGYEVLKQLCPALFRLPSYQLWEELKGLSGKERRDPEKVASMMAKYQALACPDVSSAAMTDRIQSMIKNLEARILEDLTVAAI